MTIISSLFERIASTRLDRPVTWIACDRFFQDLDKIIGITVDPCWFDISSFLCAWLALLANSFSIVEELYCDVHWRKNQKSAFQFLCILHGEFSPMSHTTTQSEYISIEIAKLQPCEVTERAFNWPNWPQFIIQSLKLTGISVYLFKSAYLRIAYLRLAPSPGITA